MSRLALWSLSCSLLLLNLCVLKTYAEEADPGDNHRNHNPANGTVDHNHSGENGHNGSPSPSTEHQAIVLTPPDAHEGGHHHHRPALLPPDEDRAYSEFNHHIAGVFVLFAGGLAMLAASGKTQFAWAHYGLPSLFLLMGIFLVFRHDPESWPHGPLSLQESLSDVQIVQHVLFTLIILGIGAIEWLRCRRTLTHPLWGLIFPALAVTAACMLFAHKHGEGLSADKIYRHHVTMAITGAIAMVIKVLDDTQMIKGKIGSYLWAGLIMFVGFMLLIYSE